MVPERRINAQWCFYFRENILVIAYFVGEVVYQIACEKDKVRFFAQQHFYTAFYSSFIIETSRVDI
ncbi:hypothetical protein D3C85_1800410 [compost metagenome]